MIDRNFSLNAVEIRQNIFSWYEKNKRNFPWRNLSHSDPYKIWVSEIILQQTRIEQGLPYYESFIARFPDVFSLAKASEDEVLRLWQGLGYYSRARNMHHTAKIIVKEFNGSFPGSFKELLSLKGIGNYTASLIASVCFNLPFPVLDGNVYRILSRLSASSIPIDSTEGKKYFLSLSEILIDPRKPGDFNEALMDLGSMICQPATPACNICPLTKFCLAFRNGNPEDFPVKSAKKPVKTRYLHYFLIKSGQSVVLLKRSGNDIWKNMFEFPLIETTQEAEIQLNEALTVLKIRKGKLKFLYSKTHILTHRKLIIYFYELSEINFIENTKPVEWLKVPFSEIKKYALPKPILEATEILLME